MNLPTDCKRYHFICQQLALLLINRRNFMLHLSDRTHAKMLKSLNVTQVSKTLLHNNSKAALGLRLIGCAKIQGQDFGSCRVWEIQKFVNVHHEFPNHPVLLQWKWCWSCASCPACGKLSQSLRLSKATSIFMLSTPFASPLKPYFGRILLWISSTLYSPGMPRERDVDRHPTRLTSCPTKVKSLQCATAS